MRITCLLPLPDREDFERRLNQIYHNGEQELLARYMQKSPSRISKQLNPYNEDAVSVPFQTLEWLWSSDCITRSRGDRLQSLITLEREKWLADFVPILNATPARLTGNIMDQFREFIEAELSGKSIDEQIQELQDVRDAADAKLRSLASARAGILRKVE